MKSSNNDIKPFFDYCKDFILDNIEGYEGNVVYGCDLGIELTEEICCDGTITFSSSESKRYLAEWWDDAAMFSDYEKFSFGQRSNPFDNVEAFIVNMVTEGVRSILSRCQFVDDKWNEKFELTEQVIEIIGEQVDEQTSKDLF